MCVWSQAHRESLDHVVLRIQLPNKVKNKKSRGHDWHTHVTDPQFGFVNTSTFFFFLPFFAVHHQPCCFTTHILDLPLWLVKCKTE